MGTTINTLLHYYIWTRLVRDPGWPAPWRTVGTTVVVALAMVAPTVMFVTRVLFPGANRTLAYPAFVWMGAMFILFTILLMVDAVKALGLLGTKVLGTNLLDPGRREVLTQAAAVASAATAGVLSTVAVRRMSDGASVKTVEVGLKNLPKELDGFTIAQLTDIHIGSTIGKDYAEHLKHVTEGIKPDLIAITGDLMDGTPDDLGDAVAVLCGMRAKHGIHFCTGNHEYYSGVDQWLPFLSQRGIRVLRNERVEILENGASLQLCGVDDYNADRFGNGHGANFDPIIKDRRADGPLILLAHQPRHVDAARAANVDLMLSGHTHGGQIWPWNLMVRLQQPYVEGLFNHDGTQLYVSPGTGYWGPPMRLGTRAEVTRLVLRPASKMG